MSAGFDLNRCGICGDPLAPDDFDGICTACDLGCCGCCGLPIDEEEDERDPSNAPVWCAACAGHVLSGGLLHERTMYAQTGRSCPYTDDFEAILSRIDDVRRRE